MKGIVSWADTDASGRFHFASVFRWVEDAEHALYRRLAPGTDVGRLPRRAVEAEYHRALVAGDEYTVELVVGRLGRSSVTFEWSISADDAVCVAGRHTIVHVDERGHPEEIPEGLRTALAHRPGKRRGAALTS